MPASVLEAPLLSQSDVSPEATPCSCARPSSSSAFTIAKLAASFLCVYSAMDALSEYITSLLPNRLGDESLFLLQAALCVSTLAAPAIVSSIGELKGMMLGGAAHAAYLVSLVRPERYFVLTTSVFCGFGASLTWVAQGTYLTKCTPPSKRGLYTGIFWGIYSMSSIVGNLGAFVTFKYLSQSAMFAIGSLSALVGVLLLFLVEEAGVSDAELTTTGKKKKLYESLTCERCQAMLLEVAAVREKPACRSAILQFLLLLPITFYLGTQTAFWTGEFTKLLPAKTIGLVLFVTGVGQVIGSFLLSWLSDHLGCSSPTFLVGALASGTGLCMCFPLQSHEIAGVFGVQVFEAPALAYTAGLCFGVADGVLTSHVFAITSKVFQGSKPEIWAVFNLLGTAGAAATFWTGMIFPISKAYGLSLQVWIQSVILLVGSPLYVILDIWSTKPSVPATNPVKDVEEPNQTVAVVPVAA